MDINNAKTLLEWTDVAWITDVEYLSSPDIRQFGKVSIVPHLRSYALICPWWRALYAHRKPCLRVCSASRIIRCKQGINLEFGKMGLYSNARARLYWLLDFVKDPLDFFKWSRLMDGVAESINGFVAVSKVMGDIHVNHLPSLGSKPFSVVYKPVTEPLRYVSALTGI
ncbi:MAG: hypothetical protein LZ170_06495 [Thaumarchaeota archaeon]|jgi:hypothetical protein|nr:hypothetical protein [Candidatus Terraquivivens yellowstonensis]